MAGKESGFTLIELIMIIMVIGILSAVATVKMSDMRKATEINSENAIIVNIQTAINNEHLRNLSNGVPEDNAWPCNQLSSSSPLNLLEPPIPSSYITRFRTTGSDWMFMNDTTAGVWLIYCPHYYGDWSYNVTKGRFWVYCYRNPGPSVYGIVRNAGDLFPGQINAGNY
jgi:prepilin-type N-terminal cleavage/methylation domain-containing protein